MCATTLAPRRQKGVGVEWMFLLSLFGAPFGAAHALMSGSAVRELYLLFFNMG